jgi:hypothetical protein
MRERRGGLSGAELVRDFGKSGLSRAEYCERMGIKISRLDYYRRQERKLAERKAGLVAVVVDSPQESDAGLRVMLRGSDGVGIEVRRGFDGDTLRRLLSVLAD